MIRGDDTDRWIEKFASVSADQLVEKEIDCVYEFTKFAHK